MTDLARAVHDALNRTATSHTPEAAPPPHADGTRPLPAPGPLEPADLGATMGRRRSTYRFAHGSPSRAQLAALLHHGVGTAPRAGGLASITPYVVTRDGVRWADLRRPVPSLVTVRAGDPTEYVRQSIDQPPFADRVPTWIALVADLAPSRDRYPARHYRTVHLDAGAALQNVLLVAAALGLATCPVSGFDDRAWARLLDLHDDAFVAVLVAAGGAATPPSLQSRR
ncbi:nitroreductase family protein [Nocardioides sp. C4-1]|uniref:nitroreductase family protein n=1 Tax=Nocardioides sp. C4-1 TaxID=3151851 RepID=UPI003262E182